MGKFKDEVDWKKFGKYTLYSFFIVAILYLASLSRGDNVFPQNLYVVFVIPVLFAIMMILNAHSHYITKRKFMR